LAGKKINLRIKGGKEQKNEHSGSKESEKEEFLNLPWKGGQ